MLLLIGGSLGLGNVWFAAARSTIPISLSGVVHSKRVALEHRPGVDDVHFLTLDDGQTIHVDSPVFDAVREGETLEKVAWSRQLKHGDRTLTLSWSVDAARMPWIMSAALALMVVLTFAAARPDREDSVDPNLSEQMHGGVTSSDE